jgi:hypothetical protein
MRKSRELRAFFFSFATLDVCLDQTSIVMYRVSIRRDCSRHLVLATAAAPSNQAPPLARPQLLPLAAHPEFGPQVFHFISLTALPGLIKYLVVKSTYRQ